MSAMYIVVKYCDECGAAVAVIGSEEGKQYRDNTQMHARWHGRLTAELGALHKARTMRKITAEEEEEEENNW